MIRLVSAAPVLRAVAAASLGGWFADWMGVPLGWLIGAMICTAFTACFIAPVRPLPYARQAGQLFIGLGIGLKVTIQVITMAAPLLPYMTAVTIYIIIISMIMASMMRRLAGIDSTTAFFATTSAGVVEMTLMAKRRGADANAVALVQTLRVCSIVLFVPMFVTLFGRDGGGIDPDALSPSLEQFLLVTIFPLAFVAAYGVSKLPRFPNAWLFGPMAIGIIVALSYGSNSGLPKPTLILAQIALGMVLGCSFSKDDIARAPRIAAVGLLLAIVLILGSAVAAMALNHWARLPIETGILAAAPAGIAEMMLTAKSLQLDAVIVAAFHLVRIIFVTACSSLLLDLYERLDPPDPISSH
jgi:uncharacterized protein